ncbi:MAG: hypothetical protein UU28_C0013G0015 [Parcubacteria group bacterium GW2011_GWD2_40_9]|nr:MAG: hypothetical protein UU28_C0013G0015 [Parcubacteria group bacterium GW2011_GWD2_40_9]
MFNFSIKLQQIFLTINLCGLFITFNLTEAYLPEKGIFVFQKSSFSRYSHKINSYVFSKIFKSLSTLKIVFYKIIRFSDTKFQISTELPGTAETDVRVRVGGGIAQVQRENPATRATEPAAAAEESALAGGGTSVILAYAIGG